MKYRLTPRLNDAKYEAPAFEVEVMPREAIDALLDVISEEMTNDYGEPFGVGFTLLIERTA